MVLLTAVVDLTFHLVFIDRFVGTDKTVAVQDICAERAKRSSEVTRLAGEVLLRPTPPLFERLVRDVSTRTRNFIVASLFAVHVCCETEFLCLFFFSC